MLRRIADSLFWAARYLEARRMARAPGERQPQSADRGPAPAGNPWSSMLAISGDQEVFEKHYENVDEMTVLTFFVLDERNRRRSQLHDAARENARSLRHRISSELWLGAQHAAPRREAVDRDAARHRRGLRLLPAAAGRFYRIAGVINGTLPRGVGFDFLGLGILLERAENVTRLLDISTTTCCRAEDVGGPIDLLQWAAVLLRSASGARGVPAEVRQPDPDRAWSRCCSSIRTSALGALLRRPRRDGPAPVARAAPEAVQPVGLASGRAGGPARLAQRQRGHRRRTARLLIDPGECERIRQRGLRPVPALRVRRP